MGVILVSQGYQIEANRVNPWVSWGYPDAHNGINIPQLKTPECSGALLYLLDFKGVCYAYLVVPIGATLFGIGLIKSLAGLSYPLHPEGTLPHPS